MKRRRLKRLHEQDLPSPSDNPSVARAASNLLGELSAWESRLRRRQKTTLGNNPSKRAQRRKPGFDEERQRLLERIVKWSRVTNEIRLFAEGDQSLRFLDLDRV